MPRKAAIELAGNDDIPDDLMLAAFDVLDSEMGVDFKTDNALPVAAAMSALWVALSERQHNPTHGRPGTYTGGCRCDECREAWRVYTADRRAEAPR